MNSGSPFVHPDNIPQMEAELSRCGVSVAEMCRRASVAETTWGRWKRKEVSPTFKTWDAIALAYQALIRPTVAVDPTPPDVIAPSTSSEDAA